MKPIYLVGIVVVLLLIGVLLFFSLKPSEENYKVNFDSEEVILIKKAALESIKNESNDEIAKLTLDTPLVNYVIRGKDRLVAEFTIENFQDYDNVFNDMEFYDKKSNMKKFERDFTYRYKDFYDVVIEDFEEVCKERIISANGTNVTQKYDCSSNKIGEHTIQKFNWIDLNEKATLSKGNITIGIFTDVSPNEYVEWIPTLYGVEIDEWAAWSENLEQNLIHYWKLDDGNGTITYDSLGRANGTMLDGEPWNTTGILESAYNFTSIGDAINYSNAQTKGLNRNWTVNFWVKGSGASGGAAYAEYVTTGFYGQAGWAVTSSSTPGRNILLTKPGAAGDGCQANYTANAWTMITIVAFANNSEYIYINASNDAAGGIGGCRGILSQTYTSTSSLGHIGSTYLAGGNINAVVDEVGIWNRSLTDAEVIQLYNSGAGISYTKDPVVTLNSPASDNETLLDSVLFNCTANATSGTLENVSLILNGVLNYTEVGPADGIVLNKNVTNLPIGNYYWSCSAISDALDIGNSVTWYLTTGMITNSRVFNTSSYETNSETFILNASVEDSSILTGTFVYDGTPYAATKTGSITEAIFTRTITIPSGIGNKTFYWSISDGTHTMNTTHQGQQISPTIFALCNSTLTIPYLNITFKNETLGEEDITSTISSTFDYWISDQSNNNTYTLINGTENANYSFCFSPSNALIEVLADIDYNNAGSQQRDFKQILSLSNSTTLKTLWLLPTADGIFVTFQVINNAEQALDGVNVTAKKGSEIVEQDFTSSDGSTTFFLNPDTTYSFIFDKEGYDSYSTTLAPTQSAYTITLGGGATSVNITENYNLGITYSQYPAQEYLFNDTTYEFNFTLASSYWTVSSFGFTLNNGSTDLTSTSNTTNGGTARLNMNTGSNETIQMNAYWVIDGNYTNVTKYWIVYVPGNTNYSLFHFFEDFNTYLGEGEETGIFGIDNFGRKLIVFIFIFIFVGIMSYKFGITSKEGIFALIFGLTLFFDIGLELLPSAIGTTTGFPTIIVALILIGIIIMEVRR